jgi:hypothetical protein
MKLLALITQLLAFGMFFFIGFYAVQKGVPKYKGQHISFVDKVAAVGGGLLCLLSVLVIIIILSKLGEIIG